MIPSLRAVRVSVSSIALLALAIAPVFAGPADDLLPRPVRQTEKRTLGTDDRGRGYSGGRGGVNASFSPDGKLLLMATEYQPLTVLEVATGRAVAQLPNSNRNEGLAAAFTPDGKHLIATNWGGHNDGRPVGIWDVAKRQHLRSLDENVNDTPFTALAVSPDGKTVALASGVGRRNGEAIFIALWDIASGDEIGRIPGLVELNPMRRNMGDLISAIAYSPDGRTLAAMLDGRVMLIELGTGKVRSQISFAASAEGRSDRFGNPAIYGGIAFSPDGRTLALAGADGAVRRIDLRTGRELPPLGSHSGPVASLCFSADGKSILSYGADMQLFVWDADANRDWKSKQGPFSDAALEALWNTLRTDDALDLFGAVHTLAASPAQTIPLLRKQVTPVPKGDQERIDRLVADVQKGEYNLRKRAVVELRKLGPAALPALRRSQERGYDELLRRLLYEFENLPPAPEQGRALRAVGVLEKIADAEARRSLKELAGGAAEAVLTVQAKSALDRLNQASSEKAAPAPELLWEELISEDSGAAHRAVRELAAQPSSAAMLRDKLKAIASKDTFNDDPKRLATLINDLDSDDFEIRDRATKSLRDLGPLAVPSLRKALEAKAKDSLEVKRRLEELLEVAEKPIPLPPETLRAGRVLESLEMMGGPEARQALETLSKDVQVKWLREAAADSLRRQRSPK